MTGVQTCALPISNLSDAKLWFSSPSSFNDPFDCAYDIVIPELKREDCVSLIARASNGQHNSATLAPYADDVLREQVARGLKSAVRSGLDCINGVSCFSAIVNDLLLWSHYADCHKGFCLEFDTADDPLFQHVQEVRYSKTLPSLGIEVFTKEDFGQLVNELILTKAKCWGYEQEWRVLHGKANHLFGYMRSSLTGVYFGAKMPEEQLALIAVLLENTDTKLYRMRLSKTSFAVEYDEINFTRKDYRKATKAASHAPVV